MLKRKRGRPRKIKEEAVEPEPIEEIPIEVKTEVKTGKSEKEKLLELYQTLKDLNIRSISDLENIIANIRE